MSIDYPAQTEDRPHLPLPIGPTPALRADAAMSDAITSFKSMASGISGLAIFLLIGVGPSINENFAKILLLCVIVWAAFTAAAFYPQQKSDQPEYRSGIEDAFPNPNWLHQTLGLVLCGAFVAGIALFLFHESLNVTNDDAHILAVSSFVFGQSAGILLDMLRGVQRLSFARSQMRSTEVRK